MNNQTVFERYELKYLLTAAQRDALLASLGERLVPDHFGHSTVCSVYYDTPDYYLIRRSLEKPAYKEKLRLRTYGVGAPSAFVELKKKYQGVVYKRRIALPTAAAVAYLNRQAEAGGGQIGRELDYFLASHPRLGPRVALFYERDAFYGAEEANLRLTFDENIRWRAENLSLTTSSAGRLLLAEGQVLLEVKTAASLPLWVTHQLTQLGLYPTSFSKYGTAYADGIQSFRRNAYAGANF